MKTVAILGAGTAGTMMANKLARGLGDGWRVVIADRDGDHVYQPGLLFVPFGGYRPDEIVRPRRDFLPSGVELLLGEVDRIDAAERRVHVRGFDPLDYDVLIIATGSRILPEATEGLTGPGWQRDAFDFYSLEGASALARRLERWEGGRLILDIVDMPIKCPVAPLEFAFLADAYFTERGMRDKVEMVYATPLDGAFTKPVTSRVLGDMLGDRGIEVLPNFAAAKVDGARRILESYDGRETDYDLLVTIPLHGGADVVRRSELGDGDGWIPTDKHTLQSKAFPNIFAIGDATDLPASKAGAVAHFEADVLIENVVRYIDDLPLRPEFDGHANCFIETGHGKAMLIDFNYETEPLPGYFPLPGIGPFALLQESRINHWGKLGFRWAYWNLLLRGEELPIDHRMVLAGKRSPA